MMWNHQSTCKGGTLMNDHNDSPPLTAYFNRLKAAHAAADELSRQGVGARVEPQHHASGGDESAASAGALLFVDEATADVRAVIARYFGKVRESELRESRASRLSRS